MRRGKAKGAKLRAAPFFLSLIVLGQDGETRSEAGGAKRGPLLFLSLHPDARCGNAERAPRQGAVGAGAAEILVC